MTQVFQILLATSLLIWNVAGDHCSFEEKEKLKEKHKICAATVQQRYSILTVETESYQNAKILETPMALKVNSGLEKDLVCKMIEETVQGCAKIYSHCFDDSEMR